MTLRSIRSDLGAAGVGALTTLPQAVAYGLIAVSPLGPEWAAFGIAASVGSVILFGLLTGLFGSNPFLVSGPTAVAALVVAVSIGQALGRGHEPAAALVLGFAGVVVAGLFQLAAGLLRLGHVVSYVPLPVLAGFVSASALLVFLNSLPMALGQPEWPIRQLLSTDMAAISPWAAVVSGLAIVLTLGLEGRVKPVPAALVGLVAGAGVYHLGVAALGLPGGPEVGPIDLGQLWHVPLLAEAGVTWGELWTDADIPLLAGLSIGLLSSFGTALSSTALDREAQVESDANRDLRVHGLANATMGVLGFLPAAGALVRSTAVIRAGAQTRLANIGSAVVFCLLLAGLAPVIAVLPLWATAGMLVATALQAVDRETLRKAYAVLSRQVAYPRLLAGDVLVTLTVVVVALVVDLVAAVGVGIALAVVLFVLGMGRDPVRRTFTGARVHSHVQRPLQQMEFLEREAHRIAVIEMQGALFFGTCARLQAETRNLLAQGAEYVILDFRHLTSIDSTGSATLRSLQVTVAEAGGRLLLSCLEPERRGNGTGGRRAGPSPPVAHQRRRAGAVPRWVWLNLQMNGVIVAVGEASIFDDTDTALAACEDLLLTRFGRAGRQDRRGIVAGSRLFARLTRDEIAGLGAFVRRHRFGAGEQVFRQGDEGDRAYFVVLGRMDVQIDIPGSSRKRRVGVLTEGSPFGEMGLLDGGPRSATITAARSASCFSIDAAGFERLQCERPEIALTVLSNLSRQFAGRLRLANAMISELEQ